MRNVLADMALEVEVVIALALRLAQAFDVHLQRFSAALRETDALQSRALTHDLVLAEQAALLLQHAPESNAQAFCASRLGGKWGGGFGTLPHTADFDTLLNRTLQTP